MPYLLAAEVDKIQDFIFRSSRLREVVGASQLLTRFCQSVELTLAKYHQGQVVVNDGGSFRVIFDSEAQALAFGADLSELYRLALGGSLTVAEPVAMDGSFHTANNEASKKLRWAKSRRQGVVAEVHMPYVAFCESCGVALAQQRDRRKGKNTSGRQYYLCQTCRIKQDERELREQVILDDLRKAYCGSVQIQDSITLDWPDDTDGIAGFDLRQRNYVAYLVADGNGMGQLFGRCDQKQITQLSEGLSQVLAKSLTEAVAKFQKIMSTAAFRNHNANLIPMLPLILGGDDLFALIPAPYALDFARQFCLAWEEQMRNLVKEVGLTDIPPPTIATAVVICKSTYPYALAHRRAEVLLKEAKHECKVRAMKTGEYRSAINFEVILGNRLAGVERAGNHHALRTSLRPYWVIQKDLPTVPQDWGIDLQVLLEQRRALKDLPNKRLAELRRCFEEAPVDVAMARRHQVLEQWTQHQLEWILTRLSASARSAVIGALEALGKPKNDGSSAHYWRSIIRDNHYVLAHGMLDLLEVWDFAQSLDYGPDDYEPQEEEA